MYRLEDKIRPPMLASPRPRDAICIGTLVALAVVMLPSMHVRNMEDAQYCIELMVSSLLLPAMGFLLALRCGAVDLSVWVSMSLGGVLAAAAINAGVPSAAGLAAGAAAGAVVGGINGLLVRFCRLPSPAATLVVALAVMWGMQQFAPPGTTPVVRENAFDSWHVISRSAQVVDDSEKGEAQQVRQGRRFEETAAPLAMTRKLLVIGVYSIMLLFLLDAQFLLRRGVHLSVPPSPLVALFASGLLAAAGGALSLLGDVPAPVPSRPIDEFLVPAAAVLAGGAFLGGHGRTMLAGILLPPSLMLATIWRQRVANIQFNGFRLQVLILICLVVLVYFAAAHALNSRRRGKLDSVGAFAMLLCGLLVVGSSACAGSLSRSTILQAIGLGVWLLGAVLLLISRALAARTHAGD